jgi:LPXTG-site transpeptidase (sortase) family protein
MSRRTRRRGRRSWKWWLANLMIIAGVLLLAYPLGTWGYTWFVQRELRQELERSDPRFSLAAAALEANVFTPATSPLGTTDPNAAAEAARLAELAAFKAAADAFAASVEGKPGTPIGRIVVPMIGMDVVMVEGVEGRDLREGPGHWPETPFPGQGGHFIVSGHRSTYGAPFLRLNKVEPGDLIFLVLPYGVAKYEVSRVIVVHPRNMKDVDISPTEKVSLAACHPIYSARQRIVAQGDLVGFKLVGDSSLQ